MCLPASVMGRPASELRHLGERQVGIYQGLSEYKPDAQASASILAYTRLRFGLVLVSNYLPLALPPATLAGATDRNASKFSPWSMSLWIAGLAIASISSFVGCGQPAVNTGPHSGNKPAGNATASNSAASIEIGVPSVTEQVPSEQKAKDAAPKIAADSVDSSGNIVLDPALAAPVTSNSQGPVAVSDLVKQRSKGLPVEANVTTDDEKRQKIAEGWGNPKAVFLISGQQNGYLEPCGCTGLDKQKGGIARRDRLLQDLLAKGWDVIPIDVGNQVRRVGTQPEIQLQTTSEVFKLMGYQAVTYGVADLKLSSTELMAHTVPDSNIKTPYVSANVSVLVPDMLPKSKIFSVNGKKFGVTGVLGNSYRDEIKNAEIELLDPIPSLKPVLADLQKQGCDFKVLLAYASLEETREIAKQVPGFQLVVCGGLGEPEHEHEVVEGTATALVQTGVKGMHAVLLGIFDDPNKPIRYQRVALSSQFKDSPRMLELFARYQEQLKGLGFKDLGANPMNHPSGNQFVGSESCGECHSKAFEVWKGTPHFEATSHLVDPGERTMIPRHFDPECVSCHSTGWHPQEFLPYVSGYESLEKTPLMTGSGCENCHGPGSKHVAVENGDLEVTDEQKLQIIAEMRLPLAKAHDKCIQCHDIDNSPDFHHDGAFEKYWEQVKHVGKD